MTHSAGDPNCPLKELNVLVTPYNLWANIQVNSSPSATVYDVSNCNHWRPFFGVRMPPPLGGLQSIQVSQGQSRERERERERITKT